MRISKAEIKKLVGPVGGGGCLFIMDPSDPHRDNGIQLWVEERMTGRVTRGDRDAAVRFLRKLVNGEIEYRPEVQSD